MNLNNFTIGQYFPGDSPIHKLDPRTKIILTIFLIAAIFLSHGFCGYVPVLVYTLLAARLSRIKLKFLIRGIKPILFIMLFTVVINLFFSTGETVLWKLGIITITKEGLKNAALMACRLLLLVTGTQLLTLTTSPIALTDGIESLMKPLKKIRFPAHEIAMMMSIALRFIPTLMEEADKIMKAQTARGADFDSGNLLKRAKALVPLLVPLFVSAFRRADELALAMEARCYRGGESRTRMRVMRFTKTDLYAALVFAALTVLCVIF